MLFFELSIQVSKKNYVLHSEKRYAAQLFSRFIIQRMFLEQQSSYYMISEGSLRME